MCFSWVMRNEKRTHEVGEFMAEVGLDYRRAAMETDIEGLTGAGRYERNGKLTTRQNGYRDRTYGTRRRAAESKNHSTIRSQFNSVMGSCPRTMKSKAAAKPILGEGAGTFDTELVGELGRTKFDATLPLELFPIPKAN